MRELWAETLMGLVVLLVAVGFLAYSLSARGVGKGSPGYELTARFGEAGGLASGANVTVAGVKVGTVTLVTLDPKSYLAVARLHLAASVKLPSDSTAKIATDGLLGGAHVAIAPGGATDDLAPGDEIRNTQGAVDLFSLIGQVIRPPGDPATPPAAPVAGPP